MHKKYFNDKSCKGIPIAIAVTFEVISQNWGHKIKVCYFLNLEYYNNTVYCNSVEQYSEEFNINHKTFVLIVY